MTEGEYKVIIVHCKTCAREFELRLPIQFYETVTADGDPVEFAGTCPDCRADDPFLRMLDEADVPTIGRDFTRRKKS